MKPNALVLALLSTSAAFPVNARAADDVCSRLVVYAVNQICQLLPNGQSICQPVALTGPDPSCALPDKPPMAQVALAPPSIQMPKLPTFPTGPNPYLPALNNPNPFAANPFLSNPYLANPFPFGLAPNPYAPAAATTPNPWMYAQPPATQPVAPPAAALVKPNAPAVEPLAKLMPQTTPAEQPKPLAVPPSASPVVASVAKPVVAPVIAVSKAETASVESAPVSGTATPPPTPEKSAVANPPAAAAAPAVVVMAPPVAPAPVAAAAPAHPPAVTPAAVTPALVAAPAPAPAVVVATPPSKPVATEAPKETARTAPVTTTPTWTAVAIPPTPAAAPVAAPAAQPAETSPKPTPVEDALAHFEVDSAELTETGRAMLDAWLAQAAGDMPIRVTGHADRLGPEPYNEKLSLQRAETIKKYLTLKGKAAKHIEIIARGEAQPVVGCLGAADPETKACLAPNRRAEIVANPPLKAVVKTAVKPAAKQSVKVVKKAAKKTPKPVTKPANGKTLPVNPWQ